MSVRIPHHGSGRHEAAATGLDAQYQVPGPGLPRVPLHEAPDRSCCCLAKPVVKVMMPPNGDRHFPVDLWLCGHHWRASRTRLAEVGASVYEIGPHAMASGGQREGAAV